MTGDRRLKSIPPCSDEKLSEHEARLKQDMPQSELKAVLTITLDRLEKGLPMQAQFEIGEHLNRVGRDIDGRLWKIFYMLDDDKPVPARREIESWLKKL